MVRYAPLDGDGKFVVGACLIFIVYYLLFTGT